MLIKENNILKNDLKIERTFQVVSKSPGGIRHKRERPFFLTIWKTNGGAAGNKGRGRGVARQGNLAMQSEYVNNINALSDIALAIVR